MVVIVFPYRDEDDNQLYVDYGYDERTGKNVCLPNDPWEIFIRLHCYFDRNLQEYVLKEGKKG